MDTFTVDWGRSWTIRALGRNPLVRFSDRVEAAVVVLVFATALAITPVAGTIGTVVYESRARLYTEQAQTRHTVAAMAIEDSTAILDQDAEVFWTEARWRVNGAEHVGSVDSANATKAGDELDVWVDGSGNQVAAPTPTWRAAVDATFAGGGAWLTAMAGVVGLSMFVCMWLTRRRYCGWDREWQALVSNDGRTGSQT